MGETENRDYLTGLYNRKGIYEQFDELPKDKKVWIMFCDLDNFKSVNDIYGHAAGDKLLVAIARLLEESVPGGRVGRLGGDEFIVLLSGNHTRKKLSGITDTIIQSVISIRRQMDFLTAVSMSIGVVKGDPTEDFSDILHKSDVAMYQAKLQGKNCCVFYDDLEAQIRLEEEMENSVEEALQSGRFQVRFLPISNLQNSRLEQTEVYVFWMKEDGTYWKQDEFRPLFERDGLIRRIDYNVFEEVCKQIPTMRVDEENRIKYSIQLSHLLLIEEGVEEELTRIMEKYGVGIDEIEIAVSESAFQSRSGGQVVPSLKRLSDAGFSMALIHFGDDFSSFRYLRELPIHTIRFDSEYLKENIKSSKGQQIIKTLIRLGKDLKQTMITDGVDEQEEVIFLSSCGCDAAGGSYYSEYLPEEEYVRFVKERTKHRNQKIAYEFRNNLLTQDGDLEGKICGDGVRFIDGISNNWGGLYFPGGGIGENVINFPEQLFSGDSFTIALWIKPDAVWSWGSVVYSAYLNGFASIVPFAGEGISIFRIYEEGDLNGWHDILCHASDLHRWTFITVTYDAYSESTRYYINGSKAGMQVNVPIMYSCRGVMLGGDPFQKSYTGSVSAFMVFDRAKTEEEIQELYQSFLEEPGFRG